MKALKPVKKPKLKIKILKHFKLKKDTSVPSTLFHNTLTFRFSNSDISPLLWSPLKT